jgi:hypothetical protein
MVSRFGLCALFATVASASLVTTDASAIEIQCIEASKYKYLYRIFDNDPKKFGAYLQVDSARLPGGEVCRAVFISGRIDSTKQSKEANEVPDGDKLLSAVAKGGGWLATIYLGSGGGNIGMGLALAQMTRLFWLKVRSPSAKSFTYQPDFVQQDAALATPQIPPELARGWSDYARAVQTVAQVSLAKGSGRCASACTFLHAAGIDRLGTAYVHRGRPGRARDKDGKPVDADLSMADTLEGLHRAEARVLALYRNMDSGEDFIRLFQSTPTATTTAATTDRFPRYLTDFLHAKCRPRPQRGAAAPATSADREEQCIAAAHEKERLLQYAKYCSGETCDRKKIVAVIQAKNRQLAPPEDDGPRKK